MWSTSSERMSVARLTEARTLVAQALWCDLRVVDDDAVFGVFCRRWGVPLIDGGTVPTTILPGRSIHARSLIHGARRSGCRGSWASAWRWT